MTGHAHHNEGIVVSGGRLEAGALAVGRGARAQQAPVEAVPELTELLRRLTRAIEQHAAELPHAPELLAATETVAREVARPQPNRLTVRALLAGIAEAAGGIAGITTAVTAIGAALGAVL
jgi:hypothetical protein